MELFSMEKISTWYFQNYCYCSRR